MAAPLRVLIAEDQFLLRDGLIRLLTACGVEVVAAVADSGEIESAVTDFEPDLALLDVRLPPTLTDEGLRAALLIRSRRPGFPIVLLSQYVDQLYAQELLSDRQGGIGYLLKDRVFDAEQFVSALRTVAGGGTVMDPEVVSGMLAREHADRLIRRLTTRELEALTLMAGGMSNSAIASKMVVTEKAVAKHINSILAKLDLPPADDLHRRVLAVLAYLNRR